MRRQVAVVAVGVLLVLSGCSLFGGGTPTAQPNGDPSPTATPVPYPGGYGATGITNATAARAGHISGLLATENFSLGYNATVRSENGTSRITLLQAVSPGEPRALTDTVIAASGTRGSGAVRRTRFYADGTQYVRVQRGDNVSYGTIDGTLPATAFLGRQYVDAALTNVTYDGVTRFEQANGTYFRLTATDIEDPGALLSERILPRDVTGGNVTLVVDRHGVVRSIRYRATVDRDGRTVRYRVAFAVAGIDRTPVERPEWARR